MAKETRYAVVVSLYVYAETDEQAKEKAQQFAQDVRFVVDRTENNASVVSIVEAPFGTIGQAREVK